MAGDDPVIVSWRTRGAARLELWIDERPWLCPLTANGSRKIDTPGTTEFRLIAGPPTGAWIEARAKVLSISLSLFVATIVLSMTAIASLWWATQGFLSDVSLIESTPVWRTVSATSRWASFLSAAVGLPLIGSLLRLWPGATSSFAVRVLQNRWLAASWLGLCTIAIVGVVALWRSTETVILSSEIDTTVHLLEPDNDNVALAVPKGVSTAIISRDGGGPLGWLLGIDRGEHVLSGGNDSIPPRVYAERQGEVWLLGCWSEVHVRYPPGFQPTIALEDGRVVPVDLQIEGRGPRSDASASTVSVLSRRARIAVPDCKRFPTHATLLVHDSVGDEALRLPFAMSLPPVRQQWAAARDAGHPVVQADIELGVIGLAHALEHPELTAVQLSGEDGWRARQCTRIDATPGSVLMAMTTDRNALTPPVAPPGSASDASTDDRLQARCAQVPVDGYRFVVPTLVNGRATTLASACAFPTGMVGDESPGALDCATEAALPWRTIFDVPLSDGPPPRLARLDLCTPSTWDGYSAELVERVVLPDEVARLPTRWRGSLSAGTDAIIWPDTHWFPARAELAPSAAQRDSPIVLEVHADDAPSPFELVRIADKTVTASLQPVWRDRIAERIGVASDPELLFDPEDRERSCASTDQTTIDVARTTDRQIDIVVEGFPASLAEEVIDAHVLQGDRRLDCFLGVQRGSFVCLR